ncbi:unnamed protein product [Dracunculus medinensis]|uniref:HAP1 N-terminal domain-containing protein n=1 Tax=Dracunculus medinensis TaxID=318479 RepID=A0A0N4UGL0_DRAME|nr:unnamed protein product [Dracunculus medinensis]
MRSTSRPNGLIRRNARVHFNLGRLQVTEHELLKNRESSSQEHLKISEDRLTFTRMKHEQRLLKQLLMQLANPGDQIEALESRMSQRSTLIEGEIHQLSNLNNTIRNLSILFDFEEAFNSVEYSCSDESMPISNTQSEKEFDEKYD